MAGGKDESEEITIVTFPLQTDHISHITRSWRSYLEKEKSHSGKAVKSRTKTAYPIFLLPSSHFLNLMMNSTFIRL
jgi:hypothetical protein